MESGKQSAFAHSFNTYDSHNWTSSVAGVVGTVLTHASQPSHSVFFFTDTTTSASTFFTITQNLEIPGGVGVFELAATESITNKSESDFSTWISDVKWLRQLSSHTTIVVVSDDLAFLAAFAHWSLKGRLLVWSTRLLVVTRLHLHHLQVHYTAFSRMNAMMLIIDDDSHDIRCNMYVHLPFSVRDTKPLWVASWTPRRGLALSRPPLFPNKFSLFVHGPNLLAASVSNAFHKMITTEDPEAPGKHRVKFMGPMEDLMDYIAKALNFSYSIVRPHDEVFGSKLDDGSWSGILGMVMRQEVELAVGPIRLSGDRIEVVDFTVPVMIDYWRMLGARGQPEVDPWGFVFPLEPLVWAAILGALLVLPTATLLMSSGLFHNTGGQRNWLMFSFDYIRILLQQDIIVKDGQGGGGWWWERVVLAVWGLVAVVLTQSYAGNLMALLAVRHISQPFQSRRQVLDDPAVTMIWLKGSGLREYLQCVESGIYREIAEAEKKGRLVWRTQGQYPRDMNTVVRRGDHVLIDVGNALITYIAQDFSRTGKCSFYSSREGFLPLNFGMISSKDNPIIPAFNKRITAATEAGLFSYWLKVAEPNATVCSNAPNKITVRTTLSISNVWGMFVVLIAGYSVSLLIFFLEVLSIMIYLN
ncbi:probable glutamate receptor [Procambarus clarkii]|uniref:probable glutamate receptor n=1 Tax=Procambarus clarkii TaxID=6728 RepID=UPI00374421CD